MEAVPTGANIDDILRHRHAHFDPGHHHQRLHVCQQLQPRFKTTHRPQEGTDRREEHRAFIQYRRSSPLADDDRLIPRNIHDPVFHSDVSPGV